MDDTGLVQLLLLLLLGFIVYLFISYLMLVIALNKKLYAYAYVHSISDG